MTKDDASKKCAGERPGPALLTANVLVENGKVSQRRRELDEKVRRRRRQLGGRRRLGGEVKEADTKPRDSRPAAPIWRSRKDAAASPLFPCNAHLLKNGAEDAGQKGQRAHGYEFALHGTCARYQKEGGRVLKQARRRRLCRGTHCCWKGFWSRRSSRRARLRCPPWSWSSRRRRPFLLKRQGMRHRSGWWDTRTGEKERHGGQARLPGGSYRRPPPPAEWRRWPRRATA